MSSTGQLASFPASGTLVNAGSTTSYELYQVAIGRGSGLVQVGTSVLTTTGNPSA